MKIEPEPTCEHCMEGDETVEHFICDCKAFAWARHRVFRTPFLNKQDLKDMDFDVLLKYIKTTGRLL